MPFSLSLMRGRPVSEDDNSDAHIGVVLCRQLRPESNRAQIEATLKQSSVFTHAFIGL